MKNPVRLPIEDKLIYHDRKNLYLFKDIQGYTILSEAEIYLKG